MANATIRDAISIHGTNPQHLIEKPIRYRIYSSPFWKEHCFALSASTILPYTFPPHLTHLGGLVGLQRPSVFLCLLQKLLQIQPSKAIVNAYLSAKEFKYLRALTAMYVRMTYPAGEVYRILEPMLEDYRKLKWRDAGGGWSVVYMDEFVDMLLTEERVCDIILPRLAKREVVEVRDGLPPRISKLESGWLKAAQDVDVERESGEDSDDSMSDVRRWKLQRLRLANQISQQVEEEEAEHEVEAEDVVYASQEDSDVEGEEDAMIKRRRFVSPTPSVSPDRQLPVEESGYLSRSPSLSPDREPAGGGYISRSPSRSPDRV